MLIDSESYIYSWILPVCTVYVFRSQKTVEVTTAGVPLFATADFPKSFVNKRGLQLRLGRACKTISPWTFSSSKQFRTCTKDDPTGSGWGFELASVCTAFMAYKPLPSPACSVAACAGRGTISTALCRFTGENAVKTDGRGKRMKSSVADRFTGPRWTCDAFWCEHAPLQSCLRAKCPEEDWGIWGPLSGRMTSP